MHSSYVESCACNGAKPKPLANVGFFYRNDLLATMISHRDKVRYLVAPAFFGKTVLCGSYADAVFDCYDTFWMNGGSVSFLRDLDDGTLASDLPRMVGAGGLVIVDDVPRLGAERASRLWDACQALLRQGSEVVLTATPGCDPMGAYRSQCMVLGPLDFLYTDDDFQSLHRFDAATRRLRPPSCAADRIAGLADRDPASYEKFLTAAIEDASAGQNVLTFALLALEEGRLGDVGDALSHKVRAEDIASETLRPYVHVDVANDAFLAKGFPLTAVARAFAPFMGRAAAALGRSSDAIVTKLADCLAARGACERAVKLMVLACSPACRAQWLRARQDRLADEGAIVACESLFRSVKDCSAAASSDLRAASALRCALMGDAGSVADLAALSRCTANPPAVRLRAAAVAATLGRADEVRTIASSEGMRALAAWVPPENASDEVHALLAFWTSADDAEAAFCRLSALSASCDCKALALAVACALSTVKAARKRKRFLKLANEALRRAGTAGQGGVACHLLYRTVKRVFPESPVPFEERWQAFAALVQRQRLQYMRALGAKRNFSASPPALQMMPVSQSEKYAVPRLHVNVFGNFQVRIGSAAVDDEVLSRQKVRAVMAVLLAHAGSELPASVLCRMLWPRSCEEKARHNLNTVLSLLRRALVLPSGECPYLYRNQGVVMLHSDLVESDRGRLLDICRLLQCEALPPDTTMEMFEEMRSIFSGGLLPGDTSNAVIEQGRREWRDRVVSASISAARQMERQGAYPTGLAIARQALEWNPEREDCYDAVIRMQAHCGQRPSAVETWTVYLEKMDSYGLSPSPSLERLYESILDGSFDAPAAPGKRARRAPVESFRARRGPVAAKAEGLEPYAV